MCPGSYRPAAGDQGIRRDSPDPTRSKEQKRPAVSVQPETETGTAAAVANEGPEEGAYSFAAMEAKWPQVWEDLKVFTPLDDGSKERRYVLDMFPYPSGDLHMGHAEAFAMGDVVARYCASGATTCCTRSAGTPSACPRRTPRSSATRTPASGPTPTSTTQAASFKRYAMSFDWSRRLHTSDPEYYRWTQWLFLQLLRARAGLPQELAGQLVPQRPDRAGQRAGRRRRRASAAAPRSPSAS